MAVQNVVLGQLIARRTYGYELIERLKEWSDWVDLSHAAIYAALRKLEQAGLIVEVSRDAPAAGGRQHSMRVIYEATPEGREHFRSWMTERPRKMPLRETVHMQLMVATEDDIPDLIEGLRRVEEECADHMSRLLCSSIDDRSGGTRSTSFGPAYVQDGLTSHWETTIAWAQRTRRSLEARLGGTGVAGRHRP